VKLGLRKKGILFLATGGIAISLLTLVMVMHIQKRIKTDLIHTTARNFVQLHKEKTLGALEGDLALAKHMAESESIRSWVRNPTNPAVHTPAMNEIKSFMHLFSQHIAFLGSTYNNAFYYLEEKKAPSLDALLNPSQYLSADKPDDSWFFYGLSQPEAYLFNVDHNDALDITGLYINVVVKENDGKPIGIVGTGFDITEFIDTFIRSQDAAASSMYVNADGVIQGHTDKSLIAHGAAEKGNVAARSILWNHVGSNAEAAQIRESMRRVGSDNKLTESLVITLDGQPRVVAITYIPPLKWYSLAAFDPNIGVFSDALPIMAVLLLAMTIGGVLILVMTNHVILRPLLQMAEGTRKVAAGDYQLTLPEGRQDEIGELNAAFNAMVSKLRNTEELLNNNLTSISEALQRCDGYEELATVLFSRLAPLLHIGQASLYRMAEDASELQLCGSYACSGAGAPGGNITMGEGLVGQCALDRRAIEIKNVPAGYARVTSGLGSASPRLLVLRPILATDRLLGVLELALFQPIEEASGKLLDTLLPTLALNMEILARNLNTRQLLEDTRQQAERMERQAALLEEQAVTMELQQKETLAAEERSRLILGAVNDGIVGMDTNGMLTFVNPAAPAMLGYIEDELLGQPLHELLHHHYPDGRDFPRGECAMYLTTRDGQARVIDNEVLWHKDGTAVPIEYSTTPIFKDGEIVGAVVVFRDITERLAVSQAMAEQRAAELSQPSSS